MAQEKWNRRNLLSKTGDKKAEKWIKTIEFQIIGRVTDTFLYSDSTPVAGDMVRAFGKNIRTEPLTSETNTNIAGRYEITYLAKTFLQSGKLRPDLIIRAFDQQGEETCWSFGWYCITCSKKNSLFGFNTGSCTPKP